MKRSGTRPAWRQHPDNATLTMSIPPSVQMVAALDDTSILRGYEAEWIHGKLRITPAGLVKLIDSVSHLASDSGDRGAVRWANRLTPMVVGCGWARHTAYGIEPA